jgi:hypothetical protein
MIGYLQRPSTIDLHHVNALILPVVSSIPGEGNRVAVI